MQAERYPTESAMLVGAAGGDPEAVRALIDAIGPVVYGFVFARVGGDESVAADLLQETLIETLRAAPTFRGDASLRTWVCAIARRRLARHYETERRQAVAESGLALLGEIDALAGATLTGGGDVVERRDEIVRALGHLPVVHRQVLVLKYLDERSVSQIAEELGRSPVQIQSLLARARDGLRRALEGGADD